MNESTAGSTEPEPNADNRAPEGAIPPLLPAPAEITPPALVSPPVPVQPIAPPEPSAALIASTAIIGVLQFVLVIVASGIGPQSENYSFRIGAVIGSTALWPLIVVGLFSIGKTFRTTRRRLIIFLVVWGIFILGHVGNITAAKRPAPVAKIRAANVAVNPVPALVPKADDAFVFSPGISAKKAVVLEQPETAGYDFSPGSDNRLIASMDGAQKERYRSITAAYAKACAKFPQNALLALERVRFIERFANSEENVIEEAAADQEAAVKELKSRFPTAPGTVLYLLERSYGEELESEAQSYEHLIGEWNAEDRAAYFLIRARAAESTSLASTLAYARQSFELHPTVAAGLLLAEKIEGTGADADRLKLLTHSVFETAEPWLKRQKLLLLLKMKAAKPSMALYTELKASSENLVLNADIAEGLAGVGQVAPAREIFAKLQDNAWGRERNNLRRFAFELRAGGQAEALAAYRAMRAAGLTADPFLCYRSALFLKYPTAGWDWDDMMGLSILAMTVGGIAILPLFLLMPVHYWSLLRTKRGKTGGWPDSRWGLRHAAVLLGVMLATDFGALWLLKPELIRSWLTDKATPENVLAAPTLLTVQSMVWAAVSAVVIALLWRGKAGALLGPGRWGWGRSFGLGIGAAFVLRMLLGFSVRIWPQLAVGEQMAALTQTNQFMVSVTGDYGVFGLLGITAVFVPVFEETVFRGVLLQALGKHLAFNWANAGQALMFALVHENYRLLPFFFALGMVGGVLTRKSGGLFCSIVMHSCNNAIAGLAIVFLHQVGK